MTTRGMYHRAFGTSGTTTKKVKEYTGDEFTYDSDEAEKISAEIDKDDDDIRSLAYDHEAEDCTYEPSSDDHSTYLTSSPPKKNRCESSDGEDDEDFNEASSQTYCDPDADYEPPKEDNGDFSSSDSEYQEEEGGYDSEVYHGRAEAASPYKSSTRSASVPPPRTPNNLAPDAARTTGFIYRSAKSQNKALRTPLFPPSYSDKPKTPVAAPRTPLFLSSPSDRRTPLALPKTPRVRRLDQGNPQAPLFSSPSDVRSPFVTPVRNLKFGDGANVTPHALQFASASPCERSSK